MAHFACAKAPFVRWELKQWNWKAECLHASISHLPASGSQIFRSNKSDFSPRFPRYTDSPKQCMCVCVCVLVLIFRKFRRSFGPLGQQRGVRGSYSLWKWYSIPDECWNFPGQVATSVCKWYARAIESRFSNFQDACLLMHVKTNSISLDENKNFANSTVSRFSRIFRLYSNLYSFISPPIFRSNYTFQFYIIQLY